MSVILKLVGICGMCGVSAPVIEAKRPPQWIPHPVIKTRTRVWQHAADLAAAAASQAIARSVNSFIKFIFSWPFGLPPRILGPPSLASLGLGGIICLEFTFVPHVAANLLTKGHIINLVIDNPVKLVE